ncbi:Mucin-associated surface protein (MASP) [Trypanosoma cruzi]|uniref:Mucin-associated surface protein (MASP), putative n=2 Tax=Trypanosoma cruzi TaxID=5693 RepID=Q4DMQ9_TRYCC|nr:mucin-associated surface protein (MASP), putative [Trypanosoma cruzi]EAN93809.1 mucin-associated surface protein (MASP), putative [Trypanosoma cruzi]PWV00924.1 Mucin-associated surface protein (MASP) [Trypanosoma cruzi]|eukprot:XP_815660.1 mucin-associated surface protein (MASP) [Trypanosoma cruzi strain CL Brener]
MAMMMTGRVLLVCALCVLWCGAWLCDAMQTSSSAPHRENAKETMTPEEVTVAIEKLTKEVLESIRLSCRMSFITSVNATLPAHNDTEVEKCVNKTAVEISGVTSRGRPAAATTDANFASPLPSSSSAASALQGQAQGSPGAAPETVKPPQTDPVNNEQLSEAPASTGGGPGGGGELADRSSRTPTDDAKTHEARPARNATSTPTATQGYSEKSPANTTRTRETNETDDTDGSTAVSHTTSPLLLLLVACAAAAAVVAA